MALDFLILPAQGRVQHMVQIGPQRDGPGNYK